MSSKAISIIILIFILISIIIYSIAMFEFATNQTFVFTPYVQGPIDKPVIYPLGTIRELTPEEINERNNVIANSTGNVLPNS